MFWAGITRTGRRISKFLEVNENMNSENFVKILKQARVPDFLKRHNLKLLQDRATPHISKPTSNYLKSQGVQTLLIPGVSPDFNPVENLFARMKRMLENRQTQTLDQLKSEVKKVWRSLPKSYLITLIESMPNRMKHAMQSNGNPTKY
jgi:transposase